MGHPALLTHEGLAVTAAPVETTPVDPAAAFSAHVEYIRENGDPLDKLSVFSFRSANVRAAIGSMAVSELMSVASGGYGPPLVAWSSIVLATGWGSFRNRYIDRPKALDRYNRGQDVADSIGQKVEFYRSRNTRGRREVTVMWDGATDKADDPYDSLGNLLQTARLAHDAGVDHLLVSHVFVEDWMPVDIKPGQNYSQWLSTHKVRIPQGASNNDFVHNLSPQEWIKLATTAKNRVGENSIDGLLKLLINADTNHKLVSFLLNNPNLSKAARDNAMLTILRPSINHRFDDVTSQPHPKGIRFPVAGQPNRRKVVVSGVIESSGETVHRMINSMPDGTTTASAGSNLDEESIIYHIENPQVDPKKTAAAVEIMLLRLLEQRVDDAHVTAAGIAQETPNADVQYQAQFFGLQTPSKEQGKTSLTAHRALRLGAAAVLGTLLWAGSAPATEAVDHYRENVAIVTQYQIAEQTGMESNPSAVPLSAINQSIDSQYPLLHAWDDVNNWSYKFDLLLHGHPNNDGPLNTSLPPDPYSKATGFAEANPLQDNGDPSQNGEGSSNHLDWQLTPHGLSTEGLWTFMTSDQFDMHADKNGFNIADSNWLEHISSYSKKEQLPIGIYKAEYPHYIEVAGSVTSNDLFLQAGDEYKQTTSMNGSMQTQAESVHLSDQKDAYVQLPVLDGMKIVGGNYSYYTAENEVTIMPLQLMTMDNGTKIVHLPGNTPAGKITYYVAPSYNSRDIVHSTGPIKFTGNFPVSINAVDNYFATLDPHWSQQKPLQRAAYIADYLHANLKYNLDPTHNGEFARDNNIAQVLRTLVGNKLAQCSIASTIEAFSDPRHINVAGAYSNDGSSMQQYGLYSRSLHMVAVDRNGNIFNAVPSATGKYAQFLEKYFDSPPPQPQLPKPGPHIPLLPIELGGLGLAVAGLGFRQRRRIGHGIEAGRLLANDWLVDQVALLGAPELNAVIDLAQAENYAASLDPAAVIARANLKSSTEQGSSETVVSAESLARKLESRPDLHNRNVQASLNRARQQSPDPAVQATLHTATRAIRKVRLARRMGPKQKQSINS